MTLNRDPIAFCLRFTEICCFFISVVIRLLRADAIVCNNDNVPLPKENHE